MFEYRKNEDEVSEKERQKKRERGESLEVSVEDIKQEKYNETDILRYQQQTDNSIKSTKENV